MAFAIAALMLCLSQSPLAEPDTDKGAGSGVAYFAGGCFWCMEPPFDGLDGVTSTTAGYMGGTVRKPSYQEVSAGTTGHAETVKVSFDPERISYGELLEVFWRNVDPTDATGQFCDRGNQYRSAIFTTSKRQSAQAMASYQALADGKFTNRVVATEVLPAKTFYKAEEKHQNYYTKNPLRYRFYRARCGRDDRLEEVWGDKAGG